MSKDNICQRCGKPEQCFNYHSADEVCDCKEKLKAENEKLKNKIELLRCKTNTFRRKSSEVNK